VRLWEPSDQYRQEKKSKIGEAPRVGGSATAAVARMRARQGMWMLTAVPVPSERLRNHAVDAGAGAAIRANDTPVTRGNEVARRRLSSDDSDGCGIVWCDAGT
jgi:hypothetical protein